MLGRATKVMIDKNTTIVSVAGKKVDIEARVAQLAALALVRTLSSTGVRVLWNSTSMVPARRKWSHPFETPASSSTSFVKAAFWSVWPARMAAR